MTSNPYLDATLSNYFGLGEVPLPGKGHTIERWRIFATLAATHGAVAIKFFEAHADALAILAEVAGATPAARTYWAVWAAEPPDARVHGQPDANADVRMLRVATGLRATQTLRLNGRKAWCSGAREVSHALVTCNADNDDNILAAIDLRSSGVTITGEGWHAVGMGATHSGDVLLRDCPALQVGVGGAYLDRPGFWHGGAGIAACWYGAALPFYWAVRDSVSKRQDPHACANLGAIDCDLHACAALRRETAAWIDAHPEADAFAPAMRVRIAVEAAVQRVIRRAGNVLGAGPLCRDAALAARFADLPVFLRQSHAERDLAALGGAHCHHASDRPCML